MRSKVKIRTLLSCAGLVVSGLFASGCATNPATGKQQIMLMSEQQEIGLGQQEDQKVVQSMGLYDDPALQQYVEDLGQQLARVSERPNLPWSFKVVDDPVVNAFALPGGYIYITRGILAHMGSEAQLVSVLGHEIGHVTARHSANQISKSQLANIGLGLGMVVAPEIAAAGDLLMTGTGLLFLKFSRDDERQADDLGLRYAERTHYDVREATAMHETLKRVSSESGGGSVPGWASTHPEPENRIDRIESQIAVIGQTPDGTTVGKDRFLRALDGISFGEDPREGFFEGNRYLHPEMAFRFDIPAEWQGVNQKQSAGAISPQRDAAIVLRLSKQRDAMQASREFVRSTGVTADYPQRGEFNGLPALWMAFQGRSGQTPVSGRVAFIEHGGRLYEFLGYTASSRWNGYSRAIDRALSSFAPVTDPRVLGVQPARLEIVELPRDMTLKEFDRLYPSSIGLEKLAILNQVGADTQLTRGDLVKRVLGGSGEMPSQ